MIQSRVQKYDDGVDVGHLIGKGRTPDEEHYLDLLIGHFNRSKEHPSVENFRLTVEAYDKLMFEIGKR